MFRIFRGLASFVIIDELVRRHGPMILVNIFFWIVIVIFTLIFVDKFLFSFL